MSKYFTGTYKNYLSKIELDKNIETNRNTLNDKIVLLDTSLKNYISMIENSSWIESGKNELLNSYIPTVKNNIAVLTNGVLNNLNKVVTLVKKDLYQLLVELRNKDEEYDRIEEKISLSQTTASDIEYLKGKLKAMDSILSNLKDNVDKKINEIKSYNTLNDSSIQGSNLSSVDLNKTAEELLKLYGKTHNDNSIVGRIKSQAEENRIKRMVNGISEGSTYTKLSKAGKGDLNTSNCIDLSLLDENWKVVNTKLNVSEYASLAYNKGIRQNSNSERYGDLCLAFSYVHASNLYNGSTTDNAESAYNWAHAGEFTDYFNDNKQETLSVVYDQVKEGKPVILQVNGNKQGTSRHFVTVVGVKSNVKSASDVKESDLLILDSWDGQLERMDTSTSRFMTTGAQCNKSYSGYYLRLLK